MKKLRYVILTLVLALSGWISTAAMIFKSPDNQMWDMWCYHDKGTWYLYFLSASKGEQYDGFSVATSPDGVHWNFAGTPVRMSDKVNDGLGNTGLGTGHTWKSPHYAQDGKFFSDFTVNGTSKSPSSYIRFVESRDLLHWQHLDIEFRPDPRWYKEDYRWDCIKAMARPGGGYYGYWTAAPKERLGFGFGETDDGVHWRALPPPLLDWAGHPVPQEVEVGGVEKIGQKYFALLTAFTRSKGNYRVVTFTADHPEGPFRAASKNFEVLPGLPYSWFPGFFPSPDGMLVPHQSMFRIPHSGKLAVYAAPLKRADVDKEGTLRFAWWRGNEALKGAPRAVRLNRSADNKAATPAFLDAIVDVRRGSILEGVVTFNDASSSERAGLVIECVDGPAGAIRFLSASATLGGTIHPDGSGFTVDPLQRIDRDLPAKHQVQFRLLLRHGMVELYFDDILMNVYSLPKSASGRIGFLNNGAAIMGLKAWTMTLPDEAPPSSVP